MSVCNINDFYKKSINLIVKEKQNSNFLVSIRQ